MQAIGIDLGGTKIAAARVAADGTCVEQRQSAVPDTTEAIEREIVGLCAQLKTADVVGVGLGLAGLVENPGGAFRWGPNVALRGTDFPSLMRTELDLMAVVDNDANVAALGEARVGAARGFAHVVMITVGTGIGGGIVIDGRLYRGASFGGEVGHMSLDLGGPMCSCGRRGCWEALASGRVLTEHARSLALAEPDGAIGRRAAGRVATGHDLVAAAGDGDARSLELLDTWTRMVGLGVHSLMCVLDPEVFVIGGGLSALGETLLGPIRDEIAHGYGAEYRTRLPEIRKATLGNDAGVVGAAILAMDAASADS